MERVATGLSQWSVSEEARGLSLDSMSDRKGDIL